MPICKRIRRKNALIQIRCNINKENSTLIAIKSTVSSDIEEEMSHNVELKSLRLVFIPEFLAEGCAIQNLTHPDRIVIGKSSDIDIKPLLQLYHWIPIDSIIITSDKSAQIGKIASNAMLAQRISSINSLSALCESYGASTTEVKNIIMADHRIGKFQLQPSYGFGGSCFKKDVLALVYLSEKAGLKEVATYWKSVLDMNDFQMKRLSKKIIDVCEHKYIICIIGAAYKAGVSDFRESPTM